MGALACALREVVPATPRTRILRLGLGGQPFPFRAGQAVLAGPRGGEVRKPYSIACAPAEASRTGGIELLVQIDGDASEPHLERLAPGMLLDVEGPFGQFVVPEGMAERDVLLIAGGTGIAPLRAMMRELLDRAAPPRLHMVYSARHADEFAYAGELKSLAGEGRLDLRMTVTRAVPDGWTGLTGRLNQRVIAAVLPGTYTRCFVCGPPSLVSDSVSFLRAAGVADDLIVTERYGAGA